MTRTYLGLICLALVLLVACPAKVLAKDNTEHTLGVGFQSHHGVGFQSHQDALAGPDALLSAKFAAAPTVEVAALVGLSLTESAFGLTFGSKALYILLPEENLNVYVAGAAYPTVGTLGLHRLDWFLGPGLAWYLPGASNVEIFAEFGLGGTIPLTRERDSAVVAPRAIYLTTTGTAVLGLHYWF